MRAANRQPTLLSRSVIFACGWITVLLAAAVSSFPQQAATPEMTTQTSAPAFQLKVERNLVVVRVIVRDRDGRTKEGLTKGDFLLYDNGKPQAITHFSIEKAPGASPASTSSEKSEDGKTVEPSASAPRRFLALFFDDVHLQMSDVMVVRAAAETYLQQSLGPADRVAIYTSSGQVTLDFTSDQEALRRTLGRLLPRPIVPTVAGLACPDISDFQAFLITEQNDARSLDIATEEGFECNCLNLPAEAQTQCRRDQQREAQSRAFEVENATENSSEYSLRGVDEIVRRMASLPGQRSVILVSPGFMTAMQRMRVSELVDRALRSNVIVSALDARGLWADTTFGDASTAPVIPINRPDLVNEKANEHIQGDPWRQEVMSTLARDTGGFFFHNSNDLVAGFREASSLPETSYVLAFSPLNLKRDGRLHTLTVKLAQRGPWTIQARRGYFAPSKTEDQAAEAKEELREVLFSPEDVNEMTSDLRTQYFRLNQGQARLSVFTHVDIGSLRFEKENDRNLDELTILLAIFDENGNVVVVKQKTVQFRMRDATLDLLRKSGLTARTTFEVKPGNYVVRQVVRDGSSSVMSGISRSVQVTF